MVNTLQVDTQKKGGGNLSENTNLKNKIEHIELPAKLLDYFLRSNKLSNINQSVGISMAPRISMPPSITTHEVVGVWAPA